MRVVLLQVGKRCLELGSAGFSHLTFTRAPITPRLVSFKNSKGFAVLFVLKKGYKYNRICAALGRS